MSDVTLKQIKDVLQEELKPVNKKLDKHSTKLDSLSLDMAEVKQRLNSLTLDMIDVQKKTDVFA